MFDSTQSQQATKQAEKKNKLSAQETPSQRGFTMDMSPMQLSVNTQNSAAFGPNSRHCADDSQATQIDEEEEKEEREVEEEEEDQPTSEDQRSNSVPADSQTDLTHKSEASKHCGIRTGSEPSASSPKATSKGDNVNVKGGGSRVTPSSLPRSGSSDLTVNSCVEETPLSSAPCSSASQSMICQVSAPVTKTGGDRRTVSDTVEEEMDEGEELEEEVEEEKKSQEEKEVEEEKKKKKSQEEEEEKKKSQEEEEKTQEDEGTGVGGSSALDLLLSQSQLLSPEPMEEGGEDGDVDSVVMLAHSEGESQLAQRDVRRRGKINNSQPIAGREVVAANGHESQVEEKMDTADGSSQSRRPVPEPEGLKDRSLSDSCGGETSSFSPPELRANDDLSFSYGPLFSIRVP